MDEFRLMTLAIIAISVPMTTWAMALHVRGAVVRRRAVTVGGICRSTYFSVLNTVIFRDI